MKKAEENGLMLLEYMEKRPLNAYIGVQGILFPKAAAAYAMDR